MDLWCSQPAPLYEMSSEVLVMVVQETRSCWNCAVEVRHAYRGGNEHEEDGESAIQPNYP